MQESNVETYASLRLRYWMTIEKEELEPKERRTFIFPLTPAGLSTTAHHRLGRTPEP